MARDEAQVAGERARGRDRGEADASGADDRHAFAAGDAGEPHAVRRDTEGFDEARIVDAEPVGQREQRRRPGTHRVGHASVGADPEDALRAGTAAVCSASEALVALAARDVRIDRDRGAVGRQAGELVPQRVGQRSEAREVEVRAADARAPDAQQLPVAFGFGDVDDLDAPLGVADAAHVRRRSLLEVS